jgi:hypothetical protein
MKAHKHESVEESYNKEHKNEKKVQGICKKNKTDLEIRANHKKKSKILATGILAIPLLKYSFIIINWHQEKIQKKIDRKSSKVLTIHGG